MAHHRIEPERATLHGTYSRDFPPVLTLDPGDTVSLRTLDAGWNLEPKTPDGKRTKGFEPRVRERDWGHALCGPIAIRGAKPGMVLGVRFDRIRPGTWGWSTAGGPFHLNERLGVGDLPEHHMLWRLDADKGEGVNQFGHRIKLHPMMGSVGMPPDEPGLHSTIPPRFCGGNIDCTELVEGTTLYLPIPVVGGLLSIGDGHAAQGDGEISGPALECPMEQVDVTLTLHEGPSLTMPRANTPAGWVSLGLHEDLHEAVVLAMNGMLDLMCELHGLSRFEAAGLADLVVDLRVTQVVNGVRGVHALLPHGAIDRV